MGGCLSNTANRQYVDKAEFDRSSALPVRATENALIIVDFLKSVPLFHTLSDADLVAESGRQAERSC